VLVLADVPYPRVDEYLALRRSTASRNSSAPGGDAE
jgi:hypothetical protein